MMRGFIATLFVLAWSIAFTQTAQIQFVIVPSNAIVKLDGNKIAWNANLKLEHGEHILEAWAPRSEYFRDTITVTSDTVITYRKPLLPSQAYADYKEAYRDYKARRITIFAEKSIIIVFNAGLTAAFFANIPGDANYHFDMAENARENYQKSISPEDIEAYKRQYNYHKDEYSNDLRKRRIYLPIVIPVTLASYGLSVWLWKKIQEKPVKPVYHEEPAPISKLDIGLLLDYRQSWQCGLTMGYKF